ncbi:hypothetical protein GCM10027085_21170 [Spirosoma aerophilum]
MPVIDQLNINALQTRKQHMMVKYVEAFTYWIINDYLWVQMNGEQSTNSILAELIYIVPNFL